PLDRRLSGAAHRFLWTASRDQLIARINSVALSPRLAFTPTAVRLLKPGIGTVAAQPDQAPKRDQGAMEPARVSAHLPLQPGLPVEHDRDGFRAAVGGGENGEKLLAVGGHGVIWIAVEGARASDWSFK